MNKQRLLVSWIGGNDLNMPEGQMTGPIWATIKSAKFDGIELIYNYSDDEVRPYVSLLSERVKCKINTRKANLSSPIDYEDIYIAAEQLLKDVVHPESDLSILLSPGTPAMQAIWVLLGKTRFPCTFYQASKEQGVEAVKIPFKLYAEYVPAVTQLNQSELNNLAQLEAPIDSAFDDIITNGTDIQTLKYQAQILAQQEVPVLICGESGTGKEMFARAIHNASVRKDKPFIAVNCGAFPSELIDSILFGHKRGAFTGAVSDKAGVFEQAHNGTLFLDEFGELEPAVQVRLLRVLQDGKYTRLGDSDEQSSNFRLITATNKNLISEVAHGRFREDLFYRVAIGVLQLPPLRLRQGDLDFLVDSLMQTVVKEHPVLQGKNISHLAKEIIKQHKWPGNIRELKATLLRAALWSSSDCIDEAEMRQALFIMEGKQESLLDRDIQQDFDINDILSEVESHYIVKALEQADGNKSKVAKLLGYNNHQTLSNRLKKLGI
ncbi:sigma-54 interaction domain-containing protein [Shewanella violacea]|uniref:Sigma-54 dependent DNA-binding response regulator n=1 Tax=Shewanella violacea (strain JCM 10179 / CIP 106290 / LMG 19151 / DSS12) TaxID=637905 RepID=D4ZI15_SHEVD|nr:sigma 54-interacting transcriptional regulator [Shewanella violacea]BAJ01314.1 sigma-54 dependent DNA-binding response regulator [Shewanella violacea DSS12]